jgi:DNA polymerase III epsilon subunit family exonuclease
VSASSEILNGPISAATFCAVDVETSALHMSSRVVEVGAVKFDTAGRQTEFQSLVNPCEHISDGATGIHGITDEMVKNSPRSPEVLSRLVGFMGNSVFIAHNAMFDTHMIGNELVRMGAELPENPVLCTVSMARLRIKGPPNYRLQSLASFLGIELTDAHNALPDARAAMQVFLAGTEGIPRDTPVAELPGLLGPFHSMARPWVSPTDTTGDPDELQRIAESRLTIEMDYASGAEPCPVVVTPHRLFSRNGFRYLRAYCHRDGITKTYRLDRISGFRRI